MIITIGNVQLNLDHIISTQYQPEWLCDMSDRGEVWDPPRPIAATLVVVTNEMEFRHAHNHQGQTVGATAVSRKRFFEGPEATWLYDVLKSSGISYIKQL